MFDGVVTCPTCGVTLVRAPGEQFRCEQDKHYDADGYVGKVVAATFEGTFVTQGGS